MPFSFFSCLKTEPFKSDQNIPLSSREAGVESKLKSKATYKNKIPTSETFRRLGVEREKTTSALRNTCLPNKNNEKYHFENSSNFQLIVNRKFSTNKQTKTLLNSSFQTPISTI